MIEPNRFYPTNSPELRILGARQTLARWRHEGAGPAYTRAGGRILYKGSDVLDWLDRQRVATQKTAA